MITQATISIIGVGFILAMAWGFYATAGRTTKGRAAFGFAIAFSLMHLITDGALRALSGDPMSLSEKTLSGAPHLYYVLWIVSALGVLQTVFDCVWAVTHEKKTKGVWIGIHVPYIIIVILCFVLAGKVCPIAAKYLPLIYAVVLFITAVWYFEKLERGVRGGMILGMVGCAGVFLINAIMKIAQIPPLAEVLLVILIFSWQGRGLVYEDEEEEAEPEMVRIIATPNKTEAKDDKADIPDKSESAEKPEKPEKEDIPETTIELSELERMMMESADKAVGRLELELRKTGQLPKIEDIPEPAPAPAPAPAGQGVITAAGMRSVEPTPMEQLEAATVLTAGSDTQSEQAIEMIHHIDDGVPGVTHLSSRPLMLEKDLNDYYHRMKGAVDEKDYDTCLEILSDMSEYRISGIHVTRYERIRHALMDEDWKTVEKELADF